MSVVHRLFVYRGTYTRECDAIGTREL